MRSTVFAESGPIDWLTTNFLVTATVLLASALGIASVRFFRFRKSYRMLAPSLPSPPFSMWLGSLSTMMDEYRSFPRNGHPHCMMTLIQRKFKLDNLWFMDVFPFQRDRQLVVTDPDLAAQICQTSTPYRKWEHLGVFVTHIIGKRSMILSEGEAWKRSRGLFNPGFALSHLMTLVPSIVDDTQIFCKLLDDQAESGAVLPMEELVAHLTIDIMGHVVLDKDFNCQTQKNELKEAFRGSIAWTPPPAGTAFPNPIRPFAQRWYMWSMDKYIGDVVEARYASRREREYDDSRRKPAVDLAIDQYIREKKAAGANPTAKLDSAFKLDVIDQMKSFLFAGHDTSSSTICYAYHLLSSHPKEMAKARAELDNVFGTDPSRTADLIKENPKLLNQLPYILSILKETLRLYPPADTVRAGGPGDFITYKGVQYPTHGFMIWIAHHPLMRRADLFPSPDDFIPERFMPAPFNYQEIPKDAWRPFERGPRSCIGQELALLELKIILAMTLREYAIKADYVEWDRKLGREKPGETLDGRRGMFGDRAYQQLIASAKPADGLPCKVQRRKHHA